MPYPHLSRAPIAEALIDIRSTLPKEFSSATLRNAKGAIRDRYPVVEERNALQAMFEFGDGVAKTRSESLGLQAVFYKSQDGRRIAQFKTDGFTMNHLSPYSRFEDLLTDAMDMWRVYHELVRPMEIVRVAVRYINRIPFPPGEDLDHLFLTGPRFPRGVPDVFNAYISRFVLADPARELSAIVTQQIEPSAIGENPVFVLDIDAYKADRFGNDDRNLEECLYTLRDYKNQIFFGSLTDRLREELL